MKTKLEMAHEWYIKHSESPIFMYTEIEQAWNYADAMQVEADKRENSVSQELSQEEWQPDWSQAPEWAKWLAMDKDGESYYFGDKPEIKSATWMPTGTTSSVFLTQSNYQGDWKDSLRERPE